jgi:hypothetical protein
MKLGYIMKKSLIVICIIVLIITGSNAMSLSNINFNLNNNDEELPDFIVYSLVLNKCRCPYGYIIKVRISNIDSEIENTTVKVKVQLDYKESIISINYTEGFGISSEYTTHLEINPIKKTHIALAEVDPPYENHPNGDITESNEDNNVKTETFTKSVTKNRFTPSEKELTKKHIVHLYQGLVLTNKENIRCIIKEIILEIAKTGDATISEIKDIVESNGINSSKVSILSTIWTNYYSDGKLYCIPGIMRGYIYGYIAKSSLVLYNPQSEDGGWGWNLCIDREWVTKESGIIVGYSGYTRTNFEITFSGNQSRYINYNFKLLGFGLLVFHGLN